MVARFKFKPVQSSPSLAERLDPFGRPKFLKGEDPAQYDALRAKIWAAIAPTNAIDEMQVVDYMNNLWDDLRLRRAKSSVWRAESSSRLEEFLCEALEAEEYSDGLQERLAEHLERHRPKDEALELARRCANGLDGDDKVDEILQEDDLDVDAVLKVLRRERAEELTKDYMLDDKAAITEVTEYLASKQKTIEDIHAEGLIAALDSVERIDRMIGTSVGFRSACLRELDRHRIVCVELTRAKRELGEMKEIDLVDDEDTAA